MNLTQKQKDVAAQKLRDVLAGELDDVGVNVIKHLIGYLEQPAVTRLRKPKALKATHATIDLALPPIADAKAVFSAAESAPDVALESEPDAVSDEPAPEPDDVPDEPVRQRVEMQIHTDMPDAAREPSVMLL